MHDESKAFGEAGGGASRVGVCVAGDGTVGGVGLGHATGVCQGAAGRGGEMAVAPVDDVGAMNGQFFDVIDRGNVTMALLAICEAAERIVKLRGRLIARIDRGEHVAELLDLVRASDEMKAGVRQAINAIPVALWQTYISVGTLAGLADVEQRAKQAARSVA